MITNTLLEPIQEKKGGKKSDSHSANALSHTTGFFILFAYAPVLLAVLAVGILLWHFQSTTQRDLESIRSSLYSMAVVTNKTEIKIGELQRLIVESSVSKTLLENHLDKLSEQITTLRSNLSTPPAGGSSGTLSKKTPTLEKSSFHHEVETGDTLFKIARKYGVPVGQVIAANNLTDNDHSYPGQRILITLGEQNKASTLKK
jgi:LysM repeat protein